MLVEVQRTRTIPVMFKVSSLSFCRLPSPADLDAVLFKPLFIAGTRKSPMRCQGYLHYQPFHLFSFLTADFLEFQESDFRWAPPPPHPAAPCRGCMSAPPAPRQSSPPPGCPPPPPYALISRESIVLACSYSHALMPVFNSRNGMVVSLASILSVSMSSTANASTPSTSVSSYSCVSLCNICWTFLNFWAVIFFICLLMNGEGISGWCSS